MWAFSNQRMLNITEQLPEYQSEMERNKLITTYQYIYINIYISGWIFQKVLAEIVQKDLISSRKALISNRRNLGLFALTSMRFPSKDSKSKDLFF